MATLFNVRGVPCAVEVDSGITEGEPDGKPEAEVQFRCAWGDRFDLLRALRGELIWTGGSTFTRIGGFAYPDSPNIWCLDVPSIVPGPGVPRTLPNGWIAYEEATVTARFGVPEYDLANDQYWSLRLGTTGEFVTLPDTTWYFLGGDPVGSELARPMPQTQIEYTAHRLPFIPQDEIDFLTPKINANPYRVGRKVYPIGTLLFCCGNTDLRASALGIEYDIGYQLIKRSVDWNAYWNPATYSWTIVTSDGTAGGVTPFQYEDFDILPV